VKCSLCEEEAVGMVAKYWCTMHGEIMAYEFRCKKHIHKKYIDFEQVNWKELGTEIP